MKKRGFGKILIISSIIGFTYLYLGPLKIGGVTIHIRPFVDGLVNRVLKGKSGVIDERREGRKDILLREENKAEDPEFIMITLKNKRKIKGVILVETDESILLDVGFGTTTIRKKTVKKISGLSGYRKESTKKEWLKYKAYASGTSKIVEIKYVDRDNIIVDAIINGHTSVSLLIDTKYPDTVLMPAIAKKIFGDKLYGPDEIGGLWPGKAVSLEKYIFLKSVKVRGVKVNNVKTAVTNAMAHRHKNADGILGRTFLDKFYINVDEKRKKLILEKK